MKHPRQHHLAIGAVDCPTVEGSLLVYPMMFGFPADPDVHLLTVVSESPDDFEATFDALLALLPPWANAVWDEHRYLHLQIERPHTLAEVVAWKAGGRPPSG